MKSLCQSLLIAILATAAFGQAKEFAIVGMRAQGSQRYKPEEIIAYSGLAVDKDRPIPIANVVAAAQKLINSGVFIEVNYAHQAAQGGMVVTLMVKDKPDDQFQPAHFDNIVWLAKPVLTAELEKRLPLFRGDVPLAGSLPDEISAAIQDVLAAKGIKAHVSSMMMSAQSGALEGMRFYVDDIDVKIAKVQVNGSAAELQHEIDGLAKKIVGQDYTETRAVSFSRFDLHDMFVKHGFLRAKIAVPQAEVLSSETGKTQVAVQFPVEQGKQYRYLGGEFVGNQNLPAKDLFSAVKLTPGQVADGVELQRDEKSMRRLYATHGFLHMTLTSAPMFNEAESTVQYRWIVAEGPLFNMGKLDFSGISDKSAENLRQLFKLHEGEPFDAGYVYT